MKSTLKAMTFVALAAVFQSGCALLAGGAAAGAGVYLTTRGAETEVAANVDKTTASTKAALQSLNVNLTGQKQTDDGGMQIYGKKGDDDVTVNIDKKTDTVSHVEATVKTSAVTWNKDEAKKIVNKIQAEARA